MALECLLQQTERFIQQVIRTAERHTKLLHGLIQSSFTMQNPESPVLLVENGLLRVQHEAVNRGHGVLLHQHV